MPVSRLLTHTHTLVSPLSLSLVPVCPSDEPTKRIFGLECNKKVKNFGKKGKIKQDPVRGTTDHVSVTLVGVGDRSRHEL